MTKKYYSKNTKKPHTHKNKQTNRKIEKLEGEKKLGQRQTEDFKSRQQSDNH